MTAPIRIARIITRLNIGGPSIQAISLSRDLRARGYETCLIHGHLGHAEGDMTTILAADGIDMVHVESLRRPISPWNDLKAFWNIYTELRRLQPQIVHTHMAKAGALGRFAALAHNRRQPAGRRAKLVHTYHGHVFEGYFGAPSTRVFLFVERLLGRRTDALVAISAQVRKDLLVTYSVAREDQVRVIPLGFNLDRLLSIEDGDRHAARRALGIPDGAIAVATVGRLTAIKQHELFLDMAATLAGGSQPFVFLIVGDGELRQPLEQQAALRGIADRVRFLGWRGDLPVIYGATDVFVLTSRNEGTPVALIEAMASGVASVSTDVGGVRDVLHSTDTGTLVPFGDGQALADAVARFAGSPELRRQTGAAAREAVRTRFDVRRLEADITALYEELVNA